MPCKLAAQAEVSDFELFGNGPVAPGCFDWVRRITDVIYFCHPVDAPPRHTRHDSGIAFPPAFMSVVEVRLLSAKSAQASRDR
jgi:hypothetical protein